MGDCENITNKNTNTYNFICGIESRILVSHKRMNGTESEYAWSLFFVNV